MKAQKHISTMMVMLYNPARRWTKIEIAETQMRKYSVKINFAFERVSAVQELCLVHGSLNKCRLTFAPSICGKRWGTRHGSIFNEHTTYQT